MHQLVEYIFNGTTTVYLLLQYRYCTIGSEYRNIQGNIGSATVTISISQHYSKSIAIFKAILHCYRNSIAIAQRISQYWLTIEALHWISHCYSTYIEIFEGYRNSLWLSQYSSAIAPLQYLYRDIPRDIALQQARYRNTLSLQ